MNSLYDISKELVDLLIEKDLKITSMESCTGGYFLSAITDIENSSKVTDGGIITYSNRDKIKYGVSEKAIQEFGVYSKETSIEMAKRARENGFDKEKLIGVGITGSLTRIDENNVDSQMGKVCYSIAYPSGNITTNEMTLDTNMQRQIMKEFVTKIIMSEVKNSIM